MGNAVSTILIDATLAYLPWLVVSKIHFSKKERWGVGMSMSLTGIAALICITR